MVINSTPHIAGVLEHKTQVAAEMSNFIQGLIRRAVVHDFSKFSTREMELFEEVTPALAGLTYGSDEYNAYLKKLKPALDNHYAENSHHPEHYSDGIQGMNILDLIEMLADWRAAVKRHNDGDIIRSFKHNRKRFNIPDALYKLMTNTAFDLWGIEIKDEETEGFQVGKFYKHPSGQQIAIVGKVQTTLYGETLVAECSDRADLKPVGSGPSFAENWVEITEEEWKRNFS